MLGDRPPRRTRGLWQRVRRHARYRRPDLTLLLIPAIAAVALVTSHVHPTHRIPIVGVAAILCLGVVFDALFRNPPPR